MQRREFILKSCMSGIALAGACFMLTDCKTTAAIHESDNEISFASSSMKGKNNFLIVSEKRHEKILVVRQPDGAFHALQLKCTHKGSPLDQKDDQLVCPSHGSIFDLEGNVVKSPAARPLKKYEVEQKNSDLIIKLT